MSPLIKAILRTLAYADIFDYPLRSEELYCSLIGQNVKRKTQDDIKKELTKKSSCVLLITYHDGFYCLKGRQKIVRIRQEREEQAQEKLKIAHRVARYLRLIPWLRLVAVTGALAMGNSDQDDDIDLLIITAQNRVWLTRFLVVLLVELVAQRRRPKDKQIKNKICLNMFLDEAHLCLPRKERNLFTAHEVRQLRPLWDRDEVYQKFIKANEWVKRYLPNWVEDTRIVGHYDIRKKKKKSRNILISQYHNIASLLECLAYRAQLAYMRSRRTTEVVESHRVRFHPQDCREWVLKAYEERLKKLHLD